MGTQYLLFLDSIAGAEDDIEIVLLSRDNAKSRRLVTFESNDTQPLLEECIDLLHEQGIQPRQVHAIALCQGAVRFTVTRLAAVIANAWGWAAAVPVVSVDSNDTAVVWEQASAASAGSTISPQYAKDPTITLNNELD